MIYQKAVLPTAPDNLPRVRRAGSFLFLGCLFSCFSALATEAKVTVVNVECEGNTCRFDVSLSHPDTGWEHYADAWRVLLSDGEVLGERILHHPHVDEQPFTRSLTRVTIPAGTNHVFIQAQDKKHGNSLDLFKVAIPAQ
ncbi:MAG: hypothetical protein ACI8P9_002419 [Parasphingorhabdus sp.]|jgi:hypothetical protein